MTNLANALITCIGDVEIGSVSVDADAGRLCRVEDNLQRLKLEAEVCVGDASNHPPEPEANSNLRALSFHQSLPPLSGKTARSQPQNGHNDQECQPADEQTNLER